MPLLRFGLTQNENLILMVNETRASTKKSNVRVRKSSIGYKSYYYLFSNVVLDIVTEITGT